MQLRTLDIHTDSGHSYVIAVRVFFDLPTGRIGTIDLRTIHLRHMRELVDRVMTRLHPAGDWNLEAITCEIKAGLIHRIKSTFAAGPQGSTLSAPTSHDWTGAEIQEFQTICNLAIKGMNPA